MKSDLRFSVLIITLLFISFIGIAQENNRINDSLKKELAIAKNDTSRVILLNNIVQSIGDQSKREKYNNELVRLCVKNESKTFGRERDLFLLYHSSALVNIGLIYASHPEYNKAIDAYKQALQLLDKVKQKTSDTKRATGYALNNMGDAYRDMGEKELNFECLEKAIKLFNEIGEQEGLAMSYSNLAGAYSEQGRTDTAIALYLKGLKIYNFVKDKHGIATINNNIGDIYDRLGNNNEALKYYHLSLSVLKNLDNKSETAFVLQNIGITYGDLGKIKEGLDYLFQALKMFEEIGDKKGAYYALSNIASIYFAQGELQKAEEIFKRNIKMTTEIDYKSGLAASYYKMGRLCSNNIQRAEEALKYLKKGLLISNSIEDYRTSINCLITIGGVMRKLNKLDTATKIYKEGLLLSEKYRFKQGATAAATKLGEGAFFEKNYKKAKEYGIKSLAVAKELGYPNELRNVSSLLYKTYKALNDNTNALAMHELFLTMSDSVKNIDAQKAIIKTQVKYEYAQRSIADSITNAKQQEIKDIRISAQTAQLKQEQTQRYALYIFLSLVVLLALISYRSYRLKTRDNKLITEQKYQLENKNNENQLLMSEIHHRVKNNLQIISSLLKLPQKQITKETAEQVMSESRNRVQSVAIIHKLLYENNNFTKINTQKYISELCNAVLHNFSGNTILLNIKAHDIQLDVDHAIPLGLIINELMLNAIKHAFVNILEPKINIELNQENGMIVLVFADNGTEDVSDQIKLKDVSFGLKMIKALTEQLKGTLDVFYLNGMNFVIKFNPQHEHEN